MTNRIWPKIAKIATIINYKFVIVIKYLKIIETTPTFALFDQFLVLVTKKFLVQCDLDLVLSKYYKERLESQ